jgi:3-phosphoshikimate 1-carboxyvinyltransferase
MTNRALLMASLAAGPTKLHHILFSDDTQHMVAALRQLGVQIDEDRSLGTCQVWGAGGFASTTTKSPIFVGNAGTVMRPLTAVLAFSRGAFELSGDPRMEERPIGDLVTALQEMGADIRYLKRTGYPPLAITGVTSPRLANTVTIKSGLSSQFVSALLIAAPLLAGGLSIQLEEQVVSREYIDMTLKMMRVFGVQATWLDAKTLWVPAQKYQAVTDFVIEPDASTASYFLAFGALAGQVSVPNLGQTSIQGEMNFVNALEAMGVPVSLDLDRVSSSKAKQLQGIDIDANSFPDTAMTLAVLAVFAKGPTLIRNIYNWRLKETDRLTAMATELRKVGARVIEHLDALEVHPPRQIQYAEIETYEDHRMAMSFALLALAPVGVCLLDPGCVAKTCPDYFSKLKQLFDHERVQTTGV